MLQTLFVLWDIRGYMPVAICEKSETGR